MPIAEIAAAVALAAGAALVLAVALAHLLGRAQGAGGLAIGLLGVVLIGFPLFERFELGLGPDGGTLSADLRARIDLAATEATLIARLDTLEARVRAFDDPPLEQVVVDPPSGTDDRAAGNGDQGAEPPAPVLPPPPDIEPLPGVDRLALVFHRSDRAGDAEALVTALRGLGFAAARVATDLSEASDASSGSARVLWQEGSRPAAEAAAEAADALPGAGDATLSDAPAALFRGDVQIQLF